MPVPKVAIVGRPNVGKSSLFNWLASKQVAVVDRVAGVTRDRVTYMMDVDGRDFEIVDTGGIGVTDADDLTEDIERQIQIGIQQASLIVFVVDAQTGVTPLDRLVAERLRKIDTPRLLVVNKCDSPRLEAEAPQFFSLTEAASVCTSVIGNRNRADLMQAILDHLPAQTDEDDASTDEPEMKLAIIGRRNVGKSTLINSLAETERMIVSEIPGTTRDSVDVRFELDGKSFIAIDTPGVRKRKNLQNDVEFYGLVRARRSITRADVVLFVFDASEQLSRVDKQLLERVNDEFKPCIFVVNKWDLALAEGMTMERWTDYLTKAFGTLRHVPIAFITAKDHRNIKKLINLGQSIFKQARMRVSTGPLNRVIRAAMVRNPPPVRQNRRPKIYFGTQVDILPPTIVLKCNDPKLFDENWKRYLLGALREELPFQEVPIKLHFRPRAEMEEAALSLDEPA